MPINKTMNGQVKSPLPTLDPKCCSKCGVGVGEGGGGGGYFHETTVHVHFLNIMWNFGGKNLIGPCDTRTGLPHHKLLSLIYQPPTALFQFTEAP